MESSNIVYFFITVYASLLPVILGGIFNMLFCRTTFFKNNTSPIDKGKIFMGKRIFGDNKTTLGFIGMIIITSIFQILWGYVCYIFKIYNLLYVTIDNNIINNLFIGAILGFMYVFMELPNSFLKRRLDIKPGDSAHIHNKFFLLLDQIDSLIGVGAVLVVFSDIKLYQYLLIILLGGLTHILINVLLVKTNLKERI